MISNHEIFRLQTWADPACDGYLRICMHVSIIARFEKPQLNPGLRRVSLTNPRASPLRPSPRPLPLLLVSVLLPRFFLASERPTDRASWLPRSCRGRAVGRSAAGCLRAERETDRPTGGGVGGSLLPVRPSARFPLSPLSPLPPLIHFVGASSPRVTITSKYSLRKMLSRC